VVFSPDTRTGNAPFYERQLIPNLFAFILCVDAKREFRCQFVFLVSELWLISAVQRKFATSKKMSVIVPHVSTLKQLSVTN